MSATATHNFTTTNNAGVPPAPSEAHQRAGSNFDFSAILQEALTKPGVINQAYRAFHNYSIGNQILAAMQLASRGLALSPIASFNAWKEKGRYVMKGQKAIQMFMPVNVKRQEKESNEGASEGGTFQVFMLRANWFSLEQTEGDDFAPEIKTPAWDAAKALTALGIEEVNFDSLKGNCMGYAVDRSIAINPLNPLKHKTRFHEIAHIVLGHTSEATMTDSEFTPRDIKEAEAEGVAYILCTLLDLPGQPESRNYIQGWLDAQELPEKSAKRIFGAADKIMKAGQ